RRIDEVRKAEDLAGIEVTSRGSSVGTGGMVTKLESVRIATSSGIPVVLTNAAAASAALTGEQTGTFFAPYGRRRTARHLWLAHAADAQGRLVVDDGAAAALRGGRASLLAAGVTGVEGDFSSGDVVDVVDHGGAVLARGLVAFDATEL